MNHCFFKGYPLNHLIVLVAYEKTLTTNQGLFARWGHWEKEPENTWSGSCSERGLSQQTSADSETFRCISGQVWCGWVPCCLVGSLAGGEILLTKWRANEEWIDLDWPFSWLNDKQMSNKGSTSSYWPIMLVWWAMNPGFTIGIDWNSSLFLVQGVKQ